MNKYRSSVCFVVFLLFFCSCRNERPKYVFFFIGDGMGGGQIAATQFYRAAADGGNGLGALSFTDFPVTNSVSTYSSFNAITCSAAAGTAMATGVRTSNGTLGLDAIHSEKVYSMAVRAKEAGMKVGVATSVSIDHATPAAFYAHQPNRNMYYEIAMDGVAAGFDLYAGSGFLQPRSLKDSTAPEVYSAFEAAGYTIARGYADFREKSAAADRMIFVQQAGNDPVSLPYAIDRKAGDLTLAQITQGAVDFLFPRAKKGFFLMVEGGKIDWACHNNDGGAAINEVADFSDAVQIALDFYRQHPEETLILVTADHETGGMGMGTVGYELDCGLFANQRQSLEKLSQQISGLLGAKGAASTWPDVCQVLEQELGFWKNISLSPEEELQLQECYKQSLTVHTLSRSMYASGIEPLARMSIDLLNRKAMLGWTTPEHTAMSVPFYAIGAGAECFNGPSLNNTELFGIISSLCDFR